MQYPIPLTLATCTQTLMHRHILSITSHPSHPTSHISPLTYHPSHPIPPHPTPPHPTPHIPPLHILPLHIPLLTSHSSHPTPPSHHSHPTPHIPPFTSHPSHPISSYPTHHTISLTTYTTTINPFHETVIMNLTCTQSGIGEMCTLALCELRTHIKKEDVRLQCKFTGKTQPFFLPT